ncbi:hypothetical protein NDU88_002465 [Pleurodeles waltl]|uniref:Uncharacterized protein n=1 Tax=Pleurodeles waltl TaxID=8319 RepID=A0AAV7RFU1_PLEWA|nr:hypothetical protein NDU88_002465 [Pleurodeles waltl]
MRCLAVGRQVNNRVSHPCNCSSQKLCATRESRLHPLTPPSSMGYTTQGATIDCILQEISAVGGKLESMDSAMASLTAEMKSMHLDIAGFQVHRLGPKRRDDTKRRRPIIACLLHHVQTCQLLKAARAHGPYDLEDRLTADFSKETSECRRAFSSLQPRLLQLDVKYGLFEPARMWITKNGESRDFYAPEDLQVFLEGLHNQSQSMDTATPIHPDMLGPLLSVALSSPAPEVVGRTTADSDPRGRDLERLTKSHDDRGQVLQAVAMHTQIADRSHSL